MSAEFEIGAAIADFHCFLVTQGFSLRRDASYPGMKSRTVEYAKGAIAIRLEKDRGFWALLIAGVPERPDEWYPVAFFSQLLSKKPNGFIFPIRQLVSGKAKREQGYTQPDGPMSFVETLAFAKANWSTILRSLGPSKRKQTHARLLAIGMENQRRRATRLADTAVEQARTLPEHRVLTEPERRLNGLHTIADQALEFVRRNPELAKHGVVAELEAFIRQLGRSDVAGSSTQVAELTKQFMKSTAMMHAHIAGLSAAIASQCDTELARLPQEATPERVEIVHRRYEAERQVTYRVERLLTNASSSM